MEKIKKNYKLEPCPCGSENTGVRFLRRNWWIVGCADCNRKTISDDEYLDYTVKWWNDRARKMKAVKK